MEVRGNGEEVKQAEGTSRGIEIRQGVEEGGLEEDGEGAEKEQKNEEEQRMERK